MNIWLVSIFEQTPVDQVFSTRFINIASEAISRGHRVTFFASTFKHNTKNQRFRETTSLWMADSYELVFLKSLRYSGNISTRRMFSHYLFSKKLIREFEGRSRPDVIFIAFPPISLVHEVTKWAEANRIPVIIDIIDPWPDTFRSALKKLPAKLQDKLLSPFTARVKASLRRVSAVSAISNEYLFWARKYAPAVSNTLCMYPAVKVREIQERLAGISLKAEKDAASFRVIYAGSLASSYDIPTILKAADILNKKYGRQILFVIAGAGPQSELILESKKSLENVDFLGRLPKDVLTEQYFHADLGLTQHVKGATQTVTYKLFDLLACGLPILNSLESEMKDIILDNRVGMFNAPGDFKTLAQQIEYFFQNRHVLQDYKKNAVALAKKMGDADLVYKRAIDLMENVAGKHFVESCCGTAV